MRILLILASGAFVQEVLPGSHALRISSGVITATSEHLEHMM